MTQQELKQNILDKKLPNFMVWCNKEQYFNMLYIDKIKEVYGIEPTYLYDIKDISNIFKGGFTENIYIMYGDLKDIKGIAKPSKNNKFIFITTEATKEQEELYKDNLVKFIEFDSVNVGNLLTELYPLNIKQAIKVATFCDNSISKCINELEKVKILDGDFIKNLNKLTMDDQMNFTIEPNEYKIIEQIVKRQIDIISLEEFLEWDNCNILGFLTLLYGTYRNILQIKEQKYTTPQEIEVTTGIKQNVIYAIQKTYNINQYDTDYLISRLNLCRELIEDIKSGFCTEVEAFYYATIC
jgi:hypothetical protein